MRNLFCIAVSCCVISGFAVAQEEQRCGKVHVGAGALFLSPKLDGGGKIYEDSKLKFGPDGRHLYGAEIGYQLNDSLRLGVSGMFSREMSLTGKLDSLWMPNESWVLSSKGGNLNNVDVERKLKSSVVMLDAHLSALVGALRPYVSLGLGVAKASGDIKLSWNKRDLFSRAAETAWNFACSVGVGVGAKLYEGVELNVGYRYLDLGKVANAKVPLVLDSKKTQTVQPEISMDPRLSAHAWTVGVSMSF